MKNMSSTTALINKLNNRSNKRRCGGCIGLGGLDKVAGLWGKGGGLALGLGTGSAATFLGLGDGLLDIG